MKMDIPLGLRYSKDNFWFRREGQEVTLGLTDFGQQGLGDIYDLELPSVNTILKKEDKFLWLETLKVILEFFIPIGGKVLKVNPDLEPTPELINHDPYGRGWMMILEPEDFQEYEELLSASDYSAYVAEEMKIWPVKSWRAVHHLKNKGAFPKK